MKNKLLLFFILVFSTAALFASGGKDDNLVADAQGSASKKKKAAASTMTEEYMMPSSMPKRTVAGTLAVLDMLDYLEVDVVAIPNTNNPINPKYESKQRIGMPMTPDMERLKAAKPDFFITVNSLKTSLEPQVKTAGIETVFLKTDTYSNYLKAMEYLGKVYGKEKKASEYVDSIKKKIDEVLNKNQKKSPKVLIIFGTPSSMSIAGENSFTGSLVKVIGGKNIWTDTKIKGPYAPMNLELIKAENPDVILRLTHVKPEESSKMFKKEFENEFWSKLAAVKNGKVYDLDNTYFAVSGNIHIKEALDMLENMIYGK
ncbi:ABC transporter substrate-binding protein [Treponema pedis]|uniref:ABC transporter substrate-binding protein n=1 Tax=Treponema pedis TaxID=409322 RepID=UPI000428650D|nr:ABC transporter substrate-binding protein [Treponema pedis]QSI04849.1 iron ABC transporter substrate-binding protein [Treponema pedis]